MKLHAKKEEKLLKRFWDRPLPPLNLDGRTDGRTDRRTDRRTTDKSALEKLRCLSAGGAKKTIDNKCFICENINIFVYVGPGGGGSSTGAPSWFTSTLSFILIYMSNIESIW